MGNLNLVRPNRTIWQEKPSESDIKKIGDINSKYFPTGGELRDLEAELGRTEDEEKKENIKKRIEGLKEEYEKLSKERQKLIDEAVTKVTKINDLDKNSGLNETLLEIMINSDLPEEVRIAALTNPNLSNYSLDNALRTPAVAYLLSDKFAPLSLIKKIIDREKSFMVLDAVRQNPNADSYVLSFVAKHAKLRNVMSSISGESSINFFEELLSHPNADEKVYKTVFDSDEAPSYLKDKILKKFPKFDQNEGEKN